MNEKVSENFNIILEYIKDLSIETPSASTLLYVRENLINYNMDIDISSLVLKNKSYHSKIRKRFLYLTVTISLLIVQQI